MQLSIKEDSIQASKKLTDISSDELSVVLSFLLPPEKIHRPLIDDFYIDQLQSLMPLANSSKIFRRQIMLYLKDSLPKYLIHPWEENWENRENNHLNNAFYTLYIHRLQEVFIKIFNYADDNYHVFKKDNFIDITSKALQRYAPKIRLILNKMPKNSYGYNLAECFCNIFDNAEYLYNIFNNHENPQCYEKTKFKYYVLNNDNNPHHLSQKMYCYKNSCFFVDSTIEKEKTKINFKNYLHKAEQLSKKPKDAENEYLNLTVKYFKTIEIIQEYESCIINGEQEKKEQLKSQIINENFFIENTTLWDIFKETNPNLIALSLEKIALSWFSNLDDKKIAASTYAKMGDYKKVAKLYELIVQDPEANSKDKIKLGKTYIYIGLYKKAEEQLFPLYLNKNDDPYLNFALALLYDFREDTEDDNNSKAMIHYRKSLGVNNQYGNILVLYNQLGYAKACYGYLNLSCLEYMNNNKDLAKKLITKILEDGYYLIELYHQWLSSRNPYFYKKKQPQLAQMISFFLQDHRYDLLRKLFNGNNEAFNDS